MHDPGCISYKRGMDLQMFTGFNANLYKQFKGVQLLVQLMNWILPENKALQITQTPQNSLEQVRFFNGNFCRLQDPELCALRAGAIAGRSVAQVIQHRDPIFHSLNRRDVQMSEAASPEEAEVHREHVTWQEHLLPKHLCPAVEGLLLVRDREEPVQVIQQLGGVEQDGVG